MSENESYIDILFDGPPGPEGGKFVEVENEAGASISVGEWLEPEPSTNETGELWRLRMNVYPSLQVLGERIHRISTEHGFDPPTMANLPEKLMLSVSELAEAMEEHRSGKPLVYFEYSRDDRHKDVPIPDVYIENECYWYDAPLEKDMTETYEQWTGDKEDLVSAGYYERDGRWYVMTSQRTPFIVKDWVKLGAFDAKPEGILVEIADSIIRNLHMMASLLESAESNEEGWTIDEVLNLKVAYNESRPHKHGRSY